ncbi:uncharacterized protein JCM15063_002981 [Sporobolomyces koalae]|uniref:uncharacterized protein n=1 Tax=Sporobolomyces koalae TaxID=500713 RepID=UPI0031821885
MPRPPPARAISSCCTCTPRSTPRPSHSCPPHRSSSAAHAACSSASPSTSSVSLHPPHSQSFTTSSAQSATPSLATASGPPALPVLDFLYPGFGFFSRSLPPRVATSTEPLPLIGPTRFPASASTDDSISYFEVPKSFSSPTPTTTTRTSNSRSVLLFSSQPSLQHGTSWRSAVLVGTCVCGRVRESCMHCRAKSTASAMIETLPPLDIKGKSREIEIPSSSTATTSSSVPHVTPFRSFLHLLDTTLPSSRVSSTSATTRASPRKVRHRSKLSKRHSPESLLDKLAQDLDLDVNWNSLDHYNKIDSIRLFSRIVKWSDSLDSAPVGPLMGTERTNSDRATQEALRLKAGSLIERFLNKIARDAENAERGRLSIAGLSIEASALTGKIDSIPDRQTQSLSRFEQSIQDVFRETRWQHPGRNEDQDKERKKRIQAMRTALSNLFEGWTRTSSNSDAGELALNLVLEYDLEPLFETTIHPESRRRQEQAYNDILKRQYGILLARLNPTPSEWVVGHADETATRLHLVRHLARSGSAGEARIIWDGIANEQLDGPAAEANRLESLTALVDGLIMERLYEDANALTAELDSLAKKVQLEAPLEPSLVLKAYQVLSKLASNQGRTSILERVQKKIFNLATSESVVVTPTESLARQIRSKSARAETNSVREMFEHFRGTREWELATKEDQAKLWSQVILSQTRINHVEGAVKTLRELVLSGLRAPTAAVNSILFGFARRGDVDRVDSLFHQLAQGDFEDTRPDVGSWNALVLARTTVKDPSAAVRVIRAMQRNQFKPNRQTWTTLMAGMVDTAQWRQTFEIYRYLEQHPSVEMRPDTATTNVVLKACVLTATPASSVIALFRQLLQRGFRPNMMTYTLVLQSLTTAGLMDIAEELYLMMDRPPSTGSTALPTSMTPVRPDAFIFSTLIAGYLKRDEKMKAKACLAEMRRRGIEPSSITLAIVVGSRLGERSTPMKVKQMIAEARQLLQEEEGSGVGLTRWRRAQPPRRDRKLALGQEAATIFAPIFQSAAKQGLTAAALELLEEVHSRNRDAVPIELYTMLMDAFRRTDNIDIAADNIKAIWDRAYESVAGRFIVARDPKTAHSISTDLTAHILTTSNLDLRVDAARSSILCVPLSILLESLYQAGRHHLFGQIWRALARQGFSFDASNWNILAIYFARDLQLERAFWISENILCRPHDDTSPVPSPAHFESAFSHVTRSSAIARMPTRLHNLRRPEQDQQRLHPTDLATLLATPAHRSESTLDLGETFEEALRVREATFWHPFGGLLEALQLALDALKTSGDAQHDGEKLSASALGDKFMSEHPRTMEAIELWRTKGERKARKWERYMSLRGSGTPLEQ